VSGPAALPPGERAPSAHWIGDWVGPRADLDDIEKYKLLILPGHVRGSIVVKALCHKPEGRGFENLLDNFIFNLPNLSSHTKPLGSLSL
jgi:hypothetical protein